MSPSFIELPEEAPQIPSDEDHYVYVLSEKGADYLNEYYIHPNYMYGKDFRVGDELVWPPAGEHGKRFNRIGNEDSVYLDFPYKKPNGDELRITLNVSKSADIFQERRSLGSERG